jgi:hypothetical protein
MIFNLSRVLVSCLLPLIWIRVASTIETMHRSLSEKNLFTNSELHLLLDSVPSYMDDSRNELFTKICADFIEESLILPDYSVINFVVTVTGQAIVESDDYSQFQETHRAYDETEKKLALNTVVGIEYIHPDGDHIDPSDFYRYIRLLFNTRGSDLITRLKKTKDPYFQSVRKVFTHSSNIKTGSVESEISQGKDAHGKKVIYSWSAVVVAFVVAILLISIAAVGVRRFRIKNVSMNSYLQKDNSLPVRMHDVPAFLDASLEHASLISESSFHGKTIVTDQHRFEGHQASFVGEYCMPLSTSRLQIPMIMDERQVSDIEDSSPKGRSNYSTADKIENFLLENGDTVFSSFNHQGLSEVNGVFVSDVVNKKNEVVSISLADYKPDTLTNYVEKLEIIQEETTDTQSNQAITTSTVSMSHSRKSNALSNPERLSKKRRKKPSRKEKPIELRPCSPIAVNTSANSSTVKVSNSIDQSPLSCKVSKLAPLVVVPLPPKGLDDNSMSSVSESDTDSNSDID